MDLLKAHYHTVNCAYYEQHSISIDPDIMVRQVQEALSFTLNVICDAGDEIIPEPFYANYNGFAASSSGSNSSSLLF